MVVLEDGEGVMKEDLSCGTAWSSVTCWCLWCYLVVVLVVVVEVVVVVSAMVFGFGVVGLWLGCVDVSVFWDFMELLYLSKKE